MENEIYTMMQIAQLYMYVHDFMLIIQSKLYPDLQLVYQRIKYLGFIILINI